MMTRPEASVTRPPSATTAPRGGRLAAFVLLSLTLLPCRFAQADETAPDTAIRDGAGAPLAIKQQIIRDRMLQLEDRMFRLSEKLAEAEPEQAKQLEDALRKARELLIRRGMDETVDLLESKRLTDAADRQIALSRDLEQVLRLLLEDLDQTRERRQEIDRLNQLRKDVEQLLQRERDLKAQADAAPRLEQMLAAIRAAIARLEGMIDRQEKLAQKTASAAEAKEVAAATELDEKQAMLREEAESLAKELEKAAMSPAAPPGEPPGEAQPADPAPAQPGESDGGQPGDAAPNQGTPPPGESPEPAPAGDGEKPQDGRPDGERPGDDAKPSDGDESPAPGDKPSPSGGEQPPSGGQSPPSGGNPPGQELDSPSGDEPRGEAALQKGMRQARNDLDRGAQEMKAAENQLDRKDLGEAVPSQRKAVEALKDALEQLKQQEQEARKQLDQAEAARKQRQLEKEARELSDRMQGQPQDSGQQNQGQPQGDQQSGDPQQGGKPQGGQPQGGQPQGGQPQGGQQGDQPPQEPDPGQQNVEQARKHMQDAGDDLEEESPAEASKDQKKAIEELEKARRQLEQALEQLRREQQDEILRGLESRFRAMLAAQQVINGTTLELDKLGADRLTRPDELRLAGISQDERQISERAGEALHILKEEGTTIVFPVIVEQMREDMDQVAERLADKSTGKITQQMEADIVTTLQELIEAIKELRKKLQDGEPMPGQGGGGQDQNPPLLPDSAELKLLRSCQQRVNNQTKTFEEVHGRENYNEGQLNDLQRIADRQQEVADMARKMNERITGQ